MSIYDDEMTYRGLQATTIPHVVSEDPGVRRSSVSPGVLQVHVRAGVGLWVVKGSSMINPMDLTTVLIHSSRPLK